MSALYTSPAKVAKVMKEFVLTPGFIYEPGMLAWLCLVDAVFWTSVDWGGSSAKKLALDGKPTAVILRIDLQAEDPVSKYRFFNWEDMLDSFKEKATIDGMIWNHALGLDVLLRMFDKEAYLRLKKIWPDTVKQYPRLKKQPIRL